MYNIHFFKKTLIIIVDCVFCFFVLAVKFAFQLAHAKKNLLLAAKNAERKQTWLKAAKTAARRPEDRARLLDKTRAKSVMELSRASQSGVFKSNDDNERLSKSDGRAQKKMQRATTTAAGLTSRNNDLRRSSVEFEPVHVRFFYDLE